MGGIVSLHGQDNASVRRRSRRIASEGDSHGDFNDDDIECQTGDRAVGSTRNSRQQQQHKKKKENTKKPTAGGDDGGQADDNNFGGDGGGVLSLTDHDLEESSMIIGEDETKRVFDDDISSVGMHTNATEPQRKANSKNKIVVKAACCHLDHAMIILTVLGIGGIIILIFVLAYTGQLRPGDFEESPEDD